MNEGNSGTVSMTFHVVRNGSANVAATVDYNTVNGLASTGSDYTATSGTLNFGIGVTTRTVTVLVNGDTTYEGNESLNLVLSNAQGGTTIADNTGIGWIDNDDVLTDVFSILSGMVPRRSEHSRSDRPAPASSKSTEIAICSPSR